MQKHSLLSASAADRWTACPGSIPMSMGIPDTAGEAAFEGTALHALMEDCLNKDKDASSYESITFESDGEVHTFELNDEQREAVQDVVDHVNTFEGMKLIEVSISYGEVIGQPEELAFGTSDIVVLDGTHLHVQDAKFGRRFVDVEENKQMLLYGMGVVKAIEAIGEKVETISLHILQPRVGGRVSAGPWTLTREELKKWAVYFAEKAKVVDEAIQTYSPDQVAWQDKYLHPSELACQWCRAAAGCPKLDALAREVSTDVQETADFLGQLQPVTLLDGIPPAKISLALSRIPLLEIYAAAVKEEALRRLGDGKSIPDYKLILGRQGHRKWQDEAAVKAYALELGATEAAMYAEPKLKSPAQMQSVFKILMESSTQEAADAVNQLTIRNAPKPALVKNEVPGDPWIGAADPAEFGLVEE